MHETMDSVSGLTDRLKDFYYFWLNAHVSGNPPSLSDLNLHQLGATLDRLVVTEILRDPSGIPTDFQFIYIGRAISGAMERHLTGHCIAADPKRGPGSRIWSAYVDLATRPRPLIVQLPYIGSEPGICCTQELFLPLNDDQMQPRYVLVGIELLGEDASVPFGYRPQPLQA